MQIQSLVKVAPFEVFTVSELEQQDGFDGKYVQHGVDAKEQLQYIAGFLMDKGYLVGGILAGKGSGGCILCYKLSDLKSQTTQEALNIALKDLEAWKAVALAAQAERDALVAQLAVIDKIHSDLTNAEMVVEGFDHVGGLITLEQVEEIGNAISYPSECLAKIQADAGRAGFIAGYMLCNDGSPLIKHNYEGFADKYAERIQQGGE